MAILDLIGIGRGMQLYEFSRNSGRQNFQLRKRRKIPDIKGIDPSHLIAEHRCDKLNVKDSTPCNRMCPEEFEPTIDDIDRYRQNVDTSLVVNFLDFLPGLCR